MRTLGEKAYQEIRTWIYRNARQIDLVLWQYLFEDGCKESVLTALTFYQNDDGGFGNTLEADCWNPNSSPYTTLQAINILHIIDYHDMNHPILQGIIRFLGSGNTLMKMDGCSVFLQTMIIPMLPGGPMTAKLINLRVSESLWS